MVVGSFDFDHELLYGTGNVAMSDSYDLPCFLRRAQRYVILISSSNCLWSGYDGAGLNICQS